MQFFLLTVLAGSGTFHSYAQKWNAAKIVLASGDTVRGQAIRGYDSIRFRSSPSADPIFFGTEAARIFSSMTKFIRARNLWG